MHVRNSLFRSPSLFMSQHIYKRDLCPEIVTLAGSKSTLADPASSMSQLGSQLEPKLAVAIGICCCGFFVILASTVSFYNSACVCVCCTSH